LVFLLQGRAGTKGLVEGIHKALARFYVKTDSMIGYD
jgi:hypothetical protein